MIRYRLNGRPVEAEPGITLLFHIREQLGLTAAKRACGEGVCGACSVIIDGALMASCVIPVERVEGKTVLTVEGIEAAEMELYVRAFSEAGAVQCGFCTPGMVIAAKALLDRTPKPTEQEVRAGIRRNICRCTGYAKIVAAVLRAAAYRRGERPESPPSGPEIGGRLPRVDAEAKIRGSAAYVDDLSAPGMLFGAALRSPHPRAKLLSLDVSAARALPGVVAVATWEDIPGERYTGHVIDDWPALIAVGEETRYVGDAVALVAAEDEKTARAALGLIEARYEPLEPLRDPEAALAPGAPAIHPAGNLLSHLELKRGDASGALASSSHVFTGTFSTPFTDHAFLEPESALAFPPDDEGVVFVRTGEQNVYDGRKYIAATLGLPEERVRVQSAYVGGGFGGKEDQTVQHHSALLAWLAGRPVKCTLPRAESTRVHVKRHAMKIDLSVGCDETGRLKAVRARVVADTGAYASLGGPVLHRAVTHLGGPYSYENIEVEGFAVYTNNPPAGAFRGFGVPQVNFALESALDALAARVGISPWEIRWRNAVRAGDVLPNGQIAGEDTALEECLRAVKPAFDAAAGAVGIACAFKNTGIGVGHIDVGRCILRIRADGVTLLTGAACIGQGLATVLTQIACGTLGVSAGQVEVVAPDTASTPDSGTTTASRQTLITGEACRRACLSALAALPESAAVQHGPELLAELAGREFHGEFEAETDPFDSVKPNPTRHIAYSYACQLAILGEDRKLARMVAAHDSGLVVNPLAFEGQVEGGMAMGIGFALTENFPLKDCEPTARFGTLGLLRATDMPQLEVHIVRREGDTRNAHYAAKGIGEISTIPTAAAIAGAYYTADGLLRNRLPLESTPYAK
ncbi:MAG TPA: selenium-dependent xanthine dehydrogenase [Rectinemataceae bacterium]|nr:selenium-dependent xanthine dehydrogenase [Rectinemataceae bacterium]